MKHFPVKVARNTTTHHQFLDVLYTVQSKLYVKLRASSVSISTVKNQHDEVGVSLWKYKASLEAQRM